MRTRLVSLVPIVACAWLAALTLAATAGSGGAGVADAASKTAPDEDAMTAAISFDTASATLESITGSQKPAPGTQMGGWFYHFCWPPTGGETSQQGDKITGEFSVDENGTLYGNCHLTRTGPAGYVFTDRSSSLSGSYDGIVEKVSFHMEGSEDWLDKDTQGKEHRSRLSISVDATAVPVSGTTATGRAQFTFKCQVVKDVTCGVESATGTIGFTLIFTAVEQAASQSPSAATLQPPASPASPAADQQAAPRSPNATASPAQETSDDGGRFPWAIALLILLLVVICGVAFWYLMEPRGFDDRATLRERARQDRRRERQDARDESHQSHQPTG